MAHQSNATNSTSSGAPGFNKIDDIIKLSITCPFAVIGIVGNLLVIAVIVSKRVTKKTNNDIFLLNLAIADLLYICFNTGGFIFHLHYFYPWNKTLSYCRVFFPMLSTPFIAGVFTISAMSLYRCYVIMNPFLPKTRPLWIHLCAVITWIMAYCLVSPLVLFSVNFKSECFVPGWTPVDYNIYFWIVTVVQYPLPLIIIFLAYLQIGLYLRRPRVPQMSFVARGKNLVTPRDETRKESIAMTKTVGAIVFLFAVLLLPLQIAMHAKVTFKLDASWTDILWGYGDRLAMIHSALNPFLYTIRTPHYRKQILAWIKGQPLDNHNFTCQKSRCQSLSASCATTEVELNERREDQAVIKLEHVNGHDSRF